MSLEGKITAPRIILCDRVLVMGSWTEGLWREAGCLDFAFDGKEDRIFSLNSELVEGVYDAEGKELWINPLFSDNKPVVAKNSYMGLQIALAEGVVYEGAGMGAHHFSLLKDGEYIGHNCKENTALDLSYGLIREIFDNKGRMIWKNRISSQK